MTMRKIVFILIIFIYNITSAQVINIERKRLDIDTTGTFGNLKSSVSLIKNTKVLWNVSFLYNILVVRDRHQWYFIGNLAFNKAENTDLVNKGYEHIRYNYDFTGKNNFYGEAFEQVQFDAIRKINKRILAGGGVRYVPIKRKKFMISVGAGSMYEYETFKEDTIAYNWLRLNSYLFVNYKITKNVFFYTTVYYQPLPDKIKDNYRLFNNTGFSIGVSNNFSFTVDYEIIYDSFLPKGIPNTVYTLKNGFLYKF
jgi:putative salt-induced outer membrane protein YdiY